MNVEFEWTESGLMCLRHIENEIEKNGGVEIYTELIERENYSFGFKNHDRAWHLMKMIENGTISRKEILKSLKIDVNDYNNLRRRYEQRNKILNNN